MSLFASSIESPLGWITIRASARGITHVHLLAENEIPQEGELSPLILACSKELREYFEGKRQVFNVPLDLQGTPFQLDVWGALQQIAFGRTLSYGEVARNIGRVKACRAVGGANHNNPVAIIVPCHRVIGKNGKLVGYGGGLDKKSWLLAHERRVLLETRDVPVSIG